MRYSSIYRPPSVHLLECFAGPLKKAHDNQISHHSGYDEHAMNEEQWDDPQPYLTLTGYPLPLTLTANSCVSVVCMKQITTMTYASYILRTVRIVCRHIGHLPEFSLCILHSSSITPQIKYKRRVQDIAYSPLLLS